MIAKFYRLTKPGIVWSHALTAIAGLLFATHHHTSLILLLGILLGSVFVVASYCVFNNILDRDIDAQMERTKGRAIPAHEIDVRTASIFAGVLGIIGVAILLATTNLLTLLVMLIGAFAYLALYTPAKTRTVHSTIIGTLSGSAPLVAGYTAATNTLDTTALILFIIMVAWQMVHFFAIAFYHFKDYAAARIPVFPVKIGIIPTKTLMLVYAVIYAVAIYALYLFSGSVIYLVAMETLSVGWVGGCVWGFFTRDDTRWGKYLFFYSLLIILVFSLTIALF